MCIVGHLSILLPCKWWGRRFLNHSNTEAVLNKRQPGDSPRTNKHNRLSQRSLPHATAWGKFPNYTYTNYTLPQTISKTIFIIIPCKQYILVFIMKILLLKEKIKIIKLQSASQISIKSSAKKTQ